MVGDLCLKGPRISTFTRGRPYGRSRSQRRVLIQEILSLVASESIKKIYKEAAVFEENPGTTRAPAPSPCVTGMEAARKYTASVSVGICNWALPHPLLLPRTRLYSGVPLHYLFLLVLDGFSMASTLSEGVFLAVGPFGSLAMARVLPQFLSTLRDILLSIFPHSLLMVAFRCISYRCTLPIWMHGSPAHRFNSVPLLARFEFQAAPGVVSRHAKALTGPSRVRI